jgi:hypothetical protein
VTFRQSFRSANLALWEEEQSRLISFRELRMLHRQLLPMHGRSRIAVELESYGTCPKENALWE